jgi:hypothetical protein
MQNYKELFEERAGIRQFDGGLSKEEAEKRAKSETIEIFIDDENLDLANPATYQKINKLKKILND